MAHADPAEPQLVAPTAALHTSWLEAREEFGPGAHLDGAGLREGDEVQTPEGFETWTARLRAAANLSIDPPSGWVHSTYRWIVTDSTYQGTIDLRHDLNDFLLDAGGHIGYSVRPTARRRGLATWALAHTLQRAAALSLDRVLITCDPDNDASIATIKRNGGQLEDTRQTSIGPKHRYWITLIPTTR